MMILNFIICRFIAHGAGVCPKVADALLILYAAHIYPFLLVLIMRRLFFNSIVGKSGELTYLSNCLEWHWRLIAALSLLLLILRYHLTGVGFQTFIKIRFIWSVSRMKFASNSLLFQLIEYDLGSLNLMYWLRHRCRSHRVA